jgi:hypothetical protein
MGVVARLDEIGKPAWLTAMVGGFILFWPVGLFILFYLFWSGRMACWKREKAGRWYGAERGADHMEKKFRRWMGERPSTGNRAFDEYREETLSRLEAEQKEFQDFLERLRHAKDKAEFDEFMGQRRGQPRDVTPPAEPAAG